MGKISLVSLIWTVLLVGPAMARDGYIDVQRVGGTQIAPLPNGSMSIRNFGMRNGYLSEEEAIAPQRDFRLGIALDINVPDVQGTLTQPNGARAEFNASLADRWNKFHPGGEITIDFIANNWVVMATGLYLQNVDLEGTLDVPAFGIQGLELDRLNVSQVSVDYYVGRRIGLVDERDNESWIEILIGGKVLRIDIEARSALGTQYLNNEVHAFTMGTRYQLGLKGLGFPDWYLQGMNVGGVAAFTGDLNKYQEHQLGIGPRIGNLMINVGARYAKLDYETDSNRTAYELGSEFTPYIRLRYEFTGL